MLVIVLTACGGADTAAVSVPTVPGSTAPAISIQPTDQAVTAGQSATFSITASGTGPLTYQWQKNGTDISGATDSTYSIPTTSLGDTGAVFTVVVSNSAGTVTSNPATLTVSENAVAGVAPTVNVQPTDQAVTAGQSATFSVTASGTGPLTYQWLKNGMGISGATSSTYTTP
ncbi:MAG: immunoglobulin domain-containing protein, partial [Rhodoferax sp.]|nr:immunoglobulin domain-containing protein [Rhodoferax sp.]